ncbi:MAG: MBL fold metallo-hydrolase [Acidothermus sp.]|nr:MBL fold metallo-hydrolase [Acidothermus sp.]
MLVVGFPAGVFATNCYVVAEADGRPCLVIDPGQDAAAAVAEIVTAHRLRPVGVVLTHGHLDHTWTVYPLCSGYDVPAYLHPADRYRLADPAATFPPDVLAALGLLGVRLQEPDDVRPLADDAELELAGLRLRVRHTPGHTEGSVVVQTVAGSTRLELGADRRQVEGPLMFSGDLLFAGSVGRTDLPGGDPEAMRASLARVATASDLPDETVVCPGHGPLTTLGHERATNPFLREALAAGVPAAWRGRR